MKKKEGDLVWSYYDDFNVYSKKITKKDGVLYVEQIEYFSGDWFCYEIEALISALEDIKNKESEIVNRMKKISQDHADKLNDEDFKK